MLELPYYAIASDGSISFLSGGTLAQRGEPGQPNRLYIVFEPTGNYFSRDTGAGWENIGSSEAASSILEKLLTVDADSSGLNASTLQSLSPTDFVRQTEKGATDGVAPLSGGVVPEQYIPAVALGKPFEVASQAAMLALLVEVGDVAIRSDINKSFMLRASPASTLANWSELRTPTDAVLSVDSRTGAVSLSDLYASINDSRLRQIRDEGTALTNRNVVDFVGAGVTVSDDGANGKTIVTVTGSSSPVASEAASGTVKGNAPAFDTADPKVYFRSDPIHAGFRDGCVPHWQSATDIRVRPGAVWIPSLRRVVDVPTELSLTPTLAANTLGYLYVYDNAGTPAVELSTTAPVNAQDAGFTNPSGFPLRGACRVKGPAAAPDFSRRYVGAVLATATANQIHGFRYEENTMLYRADPSLAPFMVLAGGGVATNFAISFAAIVPPTSRTALVDAYAATGFFYLQTSEDTFGDSTVIGSTLVQGSTAAPHYVDLNASRVALYEASAASGAAIRTFGYMETR